MGLLHHHAYATKSCAEKCQYCWSSGHEGHHNPALLMRNTSCVKLVYYSFKVLSNQRCWCQWTHRGRGCRVAGSRPRCHTGSWTLPAGQNSRSEPLQTPPDTSCTENPVWHYRHHRCQPGSGGRSSECELQGQRSEVTAESHDSVFHI